MKEWYQQSVQEVMSKLQSSHQGLSAQEAESRLQKYGENALQEAGRKKVWQVFLEQFKDLLVVILMIAAVISMLSDNVESTIVIFAVLVLNAVLGTVQHQKAEKSLDSLKALSSPSASVIRDGRKVQIPSKEVVPGDILCLEAGDLISADGRILETHSLLVNESSLTGESTNVEKISDSLESEKVALGDQKNMVFSGSLVANGRAVVVVTGTGMETEIGKIASLMNDTKEKKTPLQVSLDQFSSRLAAGIMVVCGIVFLLSLYRKMPVLDSLMFAVALAVAAIPEALSSIVTIVQAMGTQKMAKENAIIKDLKAVESLGSVSVICSDKTGTLTQNKMSVQEIYVNGEVVTPSKIKGHVADRYLLYGSVLANDAEKDEKGNLLGDPTETALIVMAEKAGIVPFELRKELPRMDEIPFDSERKRMSTKHLVDGKEMMFTKGAVDVLLERCTQIMTAFGTKDISGQDKAEILNQNEAWSRQGLRVLAFACRFLPEGEEMGEGSEQNLVFLGMVCMMDPPRVESKAAVANAKRAGIKPVMITGDHKITASAIAEKIGILNPGDIALTGQELDEMDENELQQNLEKISVYARVSPEHKIRIVNAWQDRGCIAAMTGDGVNDAPALKKADIGVAMGITGTEVSKDAASMILADDNFATIIKAVENGRNVYRNIRNAIKFLLSGNMAGILSVLYTSLLALPVPFAPVHLLFINLLTDSLPAIAIGMEPAEDGLLDQKPRDPKEGILTKEFMRDILVQGGLIAVCTMVAYHTGLATGSEGAASTMAFSTLTLARLFHGFNCRSDKSMWKLKFSSNPYSVMAFGAGVVLLAAVLFIPGLQRLFTVADLTMKQLATIGIFAIIPTLIIQAVKTLRESIK